MRLEVFMGIFLLPEGILVGGSADNRRCSTRRFENCEVRSLLPVLLCCIISGNFVDRIACKPLVKEVAVPSWRSSRRCNIERLYI